MFTGPPHVDLPRHIERAVEDISGPGLVIGDGYRVLYANRASRGGKTASIVGRRCYEVVHGLDVPCQQRGEACPFEIARETNDAVRVVHVHGGVDGPYHVEVTARPMLDERYGTQCVVQSHRPVHTASARPDGTGLIGRCRAFNDMIGLIEQVARSDVGVLLIGETGTGKELVSRAIHAASPRAGMPFVPVSCSGFAEGVFESQLFGHEKGAFTGAVSRQIGLVERARGGVMFLDEIGDVPLSLQVKLLRLLEGHRFRRVGGTEPIEADFRLISATNVDLEEAVRQGRFRLDLYHRINTFPIRLAPLRERLDDVALLAECFLQRIDSDKVLAPSAIDALMDHDFPGNIRELLNVVRRGDLMAPGETIQAKHLHLTNPSLVVAPPTPAVQALPEPGDSPFQELVPFDELEKSYVRWCVDTFSGDRRELARRLGVSERTLFRKLHAAGITDPS